MKPSTFILPVLLTTVSFSGVDVKAEGQVFREQHCYENVENYIPGYYKANGRYVSAKVSNRRRKVACDHSDYSAASYSSQHSYGHSDIAHGYHSPHQQNNIISSNIHNQLLSINHRISAMVNSYAWD